MVSYWNKKEKKNLYYPKEEAFLVSRSPFGSRIGFPWPSGSPGTPFAGSGLSSTWCRRQRGWQRWIGKHWRSEGLLRRQDSAEESYWRDQLERRSQMRESYQDVFFVQRRAETECKKKQTNKNKPNRSPPPPPPPQTLIGRMRPF